MRKTVMLLLLVLCFFTTIASSVFIPYSTTDFGIKLSATGVWSNSAPTFVSPQPINESTGITLSHWCVVTINDNNANHTLNVTYASNYTGSWKNYYTTSGFVPGGIANYTFAGHTTYDKKYWWKVYAHDGFANVSATYWYRTKSITFTQYGNPFSFGIKLSVTSAPHWSNHPPVITNVLPTNQSNGVSLSPTCRVTPTDSDSNHTFNVTFASNFSGTWKNYKTNSGVNNNTETTWVFTGASVNLTKYFWKAFVHDGFANVTKTYQFITTSGTTGGESSFSKIYATKSFGIKTQVTGNQPVTMNTPNPSDGSTAVDVATTSWSITISDPEGDKFDWNIETEPDVGSDSDTADSDGVKSCSISGLQHETLYKIFVNATSITGNLAGLNKMYTFTTLPSLTMIVDGVLSFGIKTTFIGDSPDVTLLAPSNGITELNMYPSLNISVADYQSDSFNITWSTNATGTWVKTNSTVYDGTFRQIATFANSSNTRYWWTVVIADSGLHYTNRTYSFKTRDYKWGNWSDYWKVIYGSDKPSIPSSFTATGYNSTAINLTWTKGGNATNTYIRYSTTNYPTSIISGTLLINTTDSAYNHSHLTIDTTYYYSAWSYNSSNHLFSTTYTTTFATTKNTPTVVTDPATLINYKNATLHGTLLDTGDSLTAVCRFQYDLSPTGGSVDTWNQTLTPSAFSQYIYGLNPGTLYTFRAVANNTYGTVYGNDVNFLTKPFAPSNLVANVSGIGFTFTWTKGTGTNYTVIRGKTGGYPSSPTSDVLIYNGTGTTCNHFGISPGDVWYYRAWSFAINSGLTQYSTNYSQASGTIVNITLISNCTASKTLVERDGHYSIGNYDTEISFNLWCGSGWTIDKVYSRIYTATGTLAENRTSGFTVNQVGQIKHYVYTYNPSDSLSKTVMGDFDVDIFMKVSNTTTTYAGNNISSNVFKVYVLDPPYHGLSRWSTNLKRVNISWSKGNYSDRMVVVRKNGSSYPTSPSDGTIMQNSSTLTYLNESALTTKSYSIFSYNQTTHSWSEALNIPWGALEINAFKETNPTIKINNYTVLITNKLGTVTYQKTKANNPFYVSFGDIPTGNDCVIQISKDGYYQRINTLDLNDNVFYNLTFYLAPTPEGGGTPGEPDYVPPSTYPNTIQITSKTVVDSAVNLLINLTCPPKLIIQVQGYNNSLYGHWFVIPEDKYTISGSTITIDESALDNNTAIVQVQYYCYSNESYAYQYLITVVDQTDKPIEHAQVIVKTYINTTNSWQNISVLNSDSSGQADLYLIAGKLYKFVISKSGYNTTYADWIPSTAILTHTFVLAFTEIAPPPPYKMPTFTGGRTGTTIYADYTDVMLQTINTTIRLYYYNSTDNSLILISTTTNTSENSIHLLFTSTNTSLSYAVLIWFNHTSYGSQTAIIIIDRVSNAITTPSVLNVILTNLLGSATPFIWTNIILWLAFCVMMFYADKKDAGKYLILIGGVMAFVAIIGFGSTVSSVIPILFVVVGIALEWINARRN